MDYYNQYLKYKTKYLLLKKQSLIQTGGRKKIYDNQGSIFIKYTLQDKRLIELLEKQYLALKEYGLNKMGDYHITIMDLYLNLNHPFAKKFYDNNLRKKVYKLVDKYLQSIGLEIVQGDDGMQILGLANYFFTINFLITKSTDNAFRKFYDELISLVTFGAKYEIKKTDMVRIFIDGNELISFQNFFDYSIIQGFHITVGMLDPSLIERVNQGEKELIRKSFITKIKQKGLLFIGYEKYSINRKNSKPIVRLEL